MGNDLQFNNVILNPNQVVIKSIKLAYEITNAFHNNLNASPLKEKPLIGLSLMQVCEYNTRMEVRES